MTARLSAWEGMVTTEAKALRPLAEQLITKANKRGSTRSAR